MSQEKDEQNAETDNTTSDKSEKHPGNIYDALVKSFLSRILLFIDFLVHYADENFVSEIDLNGIHAAPTHYIGPKGKEHILDLVFKCPLKPTEESLKDKKKAAKRKKKPLLAVIVFEHQTESLREIPRKLIRYISAIWDAEEKDGKPLSVPYFIVLRTGKEPIKGKPPQMNRRFAKGRNGKRIGKRILIEYDVVDLPGIFFDNLVGRPELRVLFGILKKMVEGDPDGTFDSWPEALLPLQEIEDENVRIEITKEILDFVAKALQIHNQRLDTETVHKAIKPIFKEETNHMFKTIFEEKFDEGKIEGKIEGLAEGEVIGEAKGRAGEKIESRIDMMSQFLADRFNGVPRKLEEKIQKITSVEKLNQLVKLSANCESLEEFEKALD